jgi:hypothetical protein
MGLAILFHKRSSKTAAADNAGSRPPDGTLRSVERCPRAGEGADEAEDIDMSLGKGLLL